jgi:multidrug efflux pump subunit AcrA (membrane-fusion protein)
MEERITFSGEQGSLAIEVSAYENPSATDEDDANWLASKLTVKAEPFSGSFKVAFTTHDFASLHERLKKALASLSEAVTFQSTEDDLSLTIEFNKRGTATIAGVAQPHGSRGAALHFRLDTDQSALTRTLRELESVLRRFPVKQMQ